jgi:phosphatidylinositol alpha-mannosyltransferase
VTLTIFSIGCHDKARMLRSVDVYCAPNTGGESFGIILLEALAAGTAVVASDLEAFRRVLAAGDQGLAGVLFETGSARSLAAALEAVLDDPSLRAELIENGRNAVGPFDWSIVARQVLMVYEVAIGEPVPAEALAFDSSEEEESKLSRVLRTNRAVRAMRRSAGR